MFSKLKVRKVYLSDNIKTLMFCSMDTLKINRNSLFTDTKIYELYSDPEVKKEQLYIKVNSDAEYYIALVGMNRFGHIHINKYSLEDVEKTWEYLLDSSKREYQDWIYYIVLKTGNVYKINEELYYVNHGERENLL